MTKRKDATTFAGLLLSTFRFYPKTLGHILLHSIFFAVVSYLFIASPYLPQEVWLRIVLYFVFFLLLVWIYGGMLLVVDQITKNRRLGFFASLKESWCKLGHMFLAVVISLILGVLTFSIGELVIKAIEWFTHFQDMRAIILYEFVFIALPLLVLMVFLTLFIPQLVLYKKGVAQAFKDCFSKTGSQHWLVTFFLYFLIVALFVILYPETQHFQWLVFRKVGQLFVLLVNIFWMPIVANYTLFLSRRVFQ